MVMVETSVKSGFMEVPQYPGRGRKPERLAVRTAGGRSPRGQGSTGKGMKPTTEYQGSPPSNRLSQLRKSLPEDEPEGQRRQWGIPKKSQKPVGSCEMVIAAQNGSGQQSTR